MFNPKKIIENITHFEKHFFESNPNGIFFESLVDFCHLLVPLWPTFVSAVITDKNKVVAYLSGEHMKLAFAEGQEIGDQWQFKQVMTMDVIAERSYRLYGQDFKQLIAPLHDRNGTAIGTFSCFYRNNWADFASKTSDLKGEMVQAINAGMPCEIIFRFLAEKIFHLADATHVLITERVEGTEFFFAVSEFKTNSSGNIFENLNRQKLTKGARVYGSILNTAQSFIQRSAEGTAAADTPFVEDAVNVFVVSPIISRDDIVGTFNVGFRNDALVERVTVNMIEEIAGYISICRRQDLWTKNKEATNTSVSGITADLNKNGDEKILKDTVLEMILQNRDSLYNTICQLYDVLDKQLTDIPLKSFLPVIEGLDQMAMILIRYQNENEKYRQPFRNRLHLKVMIEELILEAEEKILRSNMSDKTVGFTNRCSTDCAVEINASIKPVFERLIHSIINHSVTDVNIFFKTHCDTGKVFVSISNYDHSARTSKTSSADVRHAEGLGLIFRLSQCLFKLNDVDFSVSYATETQYNLEAGFKMASDTVVPQLPEAPTPSKGLCRILIIDDDDSLRDLMVDILESRNFTVSCHGEAISAIEDFKKNKYDLVITDLSLPGINGLELASQLKEVNPTAPVILVSGWGSEIEKIKIQNPEIDYVLSKPFNLADFLIMVESSLKQLKP